jgi:hypothetical protein
MTCNRIEKESVKRERFEIQQLFQGMCPGRIYSGVTIFMISGPPACGIALPKLGVMNVALLSDLHFKTNHQSVHVQPGTL